MPKTKYTKGKDGRYRKRIRIGYTDRGNPKYKSIYGRTIRELEENIAEFHHAKSQGLIIKNEKITLAEWAKKWLKTYKSKVSQNTFVMYQNVVENHICQSGVSYMKMIDIRSIHLQEFINQEIIKGENICNKVGLTLKQIFEQAVENNLILKNPMKKVDVPKQPKKEKRILTPAEEKAIKNIDIDLKYKLFLYIGLYTGLRRGEILALSVFDIDLKKRKLRVNKTLIFDDWKGKIKNSPKTNAGNRNVPIPQPLYALFKQFLPNLRSEYLFTMKNGNLISKSSYAKFWKRIQKTVDEYIQNSTDTRFQPSNINFTAHILRHTYATYLYYAGVDIKTASKWLGHSSISTTLDIYTHLKDNSKESEARLNDYLCKIAIL